MLLTPLSINQKKIIRSLHQAKYRQKYAKFLAQGEKIVSECCHHRPDMLYAVAATRNWWDTTTLPIPPICLRLIVTESELTGISTLQTPQSVLAVCHIPQAKLPLEGWVLYADQIRDPGNLGTLWRVADWFGIRALVTAPHTAELWQPKVIQSTMGAFLRVPVFQDWSLEGLLAQRAMPVYAAVLDGTDLYTCRPEQPGVIVIGSESHGVSEAVARLATHPITIRGRGRAESLNASVAAGIICSWLTQ